MIWLMTFSVCASAEQPSAKVTLSGQVTDSLSGEPLVGVIVSIPDMAATAVTDAQGHYHIDNLSQRTVTVQVRYLGHRTIIRRVDLAVRSQVNFVMHESSALIDEVVITDVAGNMLMRESPTPVTALTADVLQRTASTNVIDAIAHSPGVAQITTGSGISKPVIRGLGYNRIVTVADGVRQEGQQWGDEHGIEIDGNMVHSVEILKGPASLMYGSDALAGVVIMKPAPLQPKGHTQATVSSEYQTNSGLFAYSLNLAGNHRGLVWDARYSDKMAHAYRNRLDGYVPGTQLRERALSGLVGLNRNWGYSHLRLSYYHLTPSMTELEEAGEKPSSATLRHYGKTMPFQQIHHYKAVLDNTFFVGNGNVKAMLGYQQNRRQEFEDEEQPKVPGLDFMLHTLSYNVSYNHDVNNDWNITAGIGGMYQRSLNKAEEVLIPAYALFDVGVFATSRYNVGAFSLSGGLRVDRRSLHSFAYEDVFSRFSRRFTGFSGSAGVVWHLSPSANLRLNVAKGFRAPNLSELGSNGEHEGTFRYEQGNHQLKPEDSWQIDAGIDYTSPVVTAQLSLFSNFIDNYIFAARTLDMMDDVPVYRYSQGNARLMGGEALIDFHPMEALHIENTFSYVNAVQLHQPADSRYLPMTPAPRWNAEVSYTFIRDGRSLNNLYVKVGLETNFRQNHYYRANDTETATPAYSLLSAAIGTDVMMRGRKLFSINLIGENLTDKVYQNHLSRLKYAGENPWTLRQGFYNEGRNVTLKVLVPIAL